MKSQASINVSSWFYYKEISSNGLNKGGSNNLAVNCSCEELPFFFIRKEQEIIMSLRTGENTVIFGQ